MPTDDEIASQLQRATEHAGEGASLYPRLSFEQGVESALSWVLGKTLDAPMDDERPEERARAEASNR